MNKEDNNLKSSRKEKRKIDIDIEDKKDVKSKINVKKLRKSTNVNVDDNKENISNIDINSNNDDVNPTNSNIDNNDNDFSNVNPTNSNNDDDYDISDVNPTIANLVDVIGSYAKFTHSMNTLKIRDLETIRDDFLDNKNILDEIEKIKNKNEYFKFTEKDIASFSNNFVKYFDL